MTEIKNVLENRGKLYGEYNLNATYSHNLKELIRTNPTYSRLPVEHKEALDNIMQKVARILNGNSQYEDNWIDIIGYSQLVLDSIKNTNELKLRELR